MTTPAPALSPVRGLVELARNVAQDHDDDCNGWATPARAALAAWEQRPRLRDDEAFLGALDSAIRGRTNWYPDPAWIRDIAGAIEAALGLGAGPP